MRIARQGMEFIRLRLGKQRGSSGGNALCEIAQGVLLPEPQIGEHLIIAAAPGVQAFARVAQTGDQQSLDLAVHVLVGDLHRPFSFHEFLVQAL